MRINPAKPVYRDLGLTALFLLALVLLPTMASMDASAASAVSSTTSASDVVAMAQWRLYLIISAPSWFAAAIILATADVKLLVSRRQLRLKSS
jgi:hypothetical protein